MNGVDIRSITPTRLRYEAAWSFDSIDAAGDALIEVAKTLAKSVPTEGLDVEERLRLQLTQQDIPIAYLVIKQVIERSIPNIEATDNLKFMFVKLLDDILGLGSLSNSDAVRTGKLVSVIRRQQAKLAQDGNSIKAATKNQALKRAISKVAGDTPLQATRKFAESIEADVRQELGRQPKERGFSAKTIQSQIKAILEERR